MFLLRGKDVFAPAAIEGYANLLRSAAYAASPSDRGLAADLRRMADEVSNVGAAMIAWQASHPDRVKIPD